MCGRDREYVAAVSYFLGAGQEGGWVVRGFKNIALKKRWPPSNFDNLHIARKLVSRARYQLVQFVQFNLITFFKQSNDEVASVPSTCRLSQ